MAKVVIYTTAICPYCIRAKMLLKKLNIDYEEKFVKNVQDMQNLIDRTGWQTVPQIFIDGKFIGGCDDLYALHEKEELEKLLS